MRNPHHRRRKNELTLTFITAKEKRAVFDDGPAKYGTEVIVPEFVLRPFKEVAGIEVIVPQKIVCAPVEIVCTTLEDQIYGCAGIASVLRRALCLQTEFADGIHRQQSRGRSGHATLIKGRLITERIVVVHAIDQEDVRFLALTADGKRSERAALRPRRSAG